MTLSRRIGLGFTLGVDSSGSTSFTTLGAIVSGFDEDGSKADMADISVLIDQFKPFAKGQIDPGGMTFQIAHDPDDGSSTLLKTMHDASPATPPNWQISYPSGTQGAGTITTKTFKAHVSGVKRVYQKDILVVSEVTLKKSGDPGL